MDRPAPQRQNIFDLTAHESAWLGLPHAELLIEAFEAIAQKRLQVHFDESPSTTSLIARTGVTWRALIKQAISALERNPHFFVAWFRSVMVDPNDYRRWRDKRSGELKAVNTRQSARVSHAKLLEKIRLYVERERAEGRTVSQKRLWEHAKTALPGASNRQVIAALKTVEGGPKKRGRPRIAKAS
jgi:hypothetical protein